MAKNKSDHAEHLKGIIKKQDKIIRELKKQASRSNKQSQRYTEDEALAEEYIKDYKKEQRTLSKDICPECGKGKLEKVSLGVRKMFVCNSCEYRKITK